MKKTLDPRDVYWCYRIENFPEDIDDEKLSLELAVIGFNNWELVSIREYRRDIKIYRGIDKPADWENKKFLKYIFKQPCLPNDYNDE